MVTRVRNLIIAANLYIEDPEDRRRFKERLFNHLSENDPDTLYQFMNGE